MTTTSINNNPEALYGPLFLEQLRLEAKARTDAQEYLANCYTKAKEVKKNAGESSLGSKFIDKQFDAVAQNVQAFLDSATSKRGTKPEYYALVEQLLTIYKDREGLLVNILAYTSMSAMLSAVLAKEHGLSNVCATISKAIQHEASFEEFLILHPDAEYSISKGIDKRVDPAYRYYYAKKRMGHTGYTWAAWSTRGAYELGAKLVELVIDGSGYFEMMYGDGGLQEIHGTQWLLEAWNTNEARTIEAAYRLIPTIIPPQPWSSMHSGGYYGDLSHHSHLLRLKDFTGANTFSREHLSRLEQVDLSRLYASINAIQETPWAVNKKVFDVVSAVMKMGGGMAGIPLIDKPEPPVRLADDEATMAAWKKECHEFYQQEPARVSKGLRALAVFNTAKAFSKYDQIYFPMNCDFRGRVYPMSPGLNPQGDDLAKGLITFVDAPPIQNAQDIEWLAIHGANLAGVDKVAFTDRIKWVYDHEAAILEAAEAPMVHRFWADQEEPIQFLAFCFEWQKYKQWMATHGSAIGLVLNIPIALDGTCSGLQHFSAILRDPIGGAAVNLLPAEKPQDIYARVAEQVSKQIAVEAMLGTGDEEITDEEGKTYIKYGTRTIAQWWQLYGVNRKVTKRCVMTLAYGSKEYGFKNQIYTDIIDKAKKEGRGDMFINGNQAAAYMAKHIWKSVSTVVVKAVEGMAWLQTVAKAVTKQGSVVTWTTPMGLPVQQSYMEMDKDSFKMRFRGKIQRFYTCIPTGRISKREQTSGIAPNFIHSMDAAHLQLTCLMAKGNGINHLAMIHDSYGAPVSQIGRMSQIVREAMIEMYTKNDVLASFATEMTHYLDGSDKLPQPPAPGTLDLNDILKSPYTFA
jgi:DNA-directed RNA polymerase